MDQLRAKSISIHALLAESDPGCSCRAYFACISIHALLAESDGLKVIISFITQIFLSTLSLRRATYSLPALKLIVRHFYPRSPCGERRFARIMIVSSGSFLSTLSLRRATSSPRVTMRTWKISIHALLAESDRFSLS